MTQSAEVKLHTTATAFDLFGGEEILIDTIARGAELSLGLCHWKDYFILCKELFNDPDFIAGLVPLLFALIPAYMM